MVNFISKTPKEKPEYNFSFNISHLLQANFGSFIAYKKNKVGFTISGLANYQKPFDVDKDDFTELPKALDFTIHPKLFLYLNANNTLVVGNSYTNSDRIGGDIKVIKYQADTNHVYFEKNNTHRNISTIDFTHVFKNDNKLIIKNSFSYFNRKIEIPNYGFQGKSFNNYFDISYFHKKNKHTIVAGLNNNTDIFKEANNFRDFQTHTTGIFAQHTFDISKKIILESGLRADIVHYSNQNYKKTEFFVLPKFSVLFIINTHWSSRIGGGLGYKSPTLFTEETETLQYQNIDALNNVKSERSYGATADMTYKTAIGKKVFFAINNLFFYTNIQHASILQNDGIGNLHFINSAKPVNSLGIESNMKWIFFENLKFFSGYTFTYAKAKYLEGNQFIRLLPKHKLNLTLIYEKENNFKIGIEAYYSSKQLLSNGSSTPNFWELGFMAQKTFGIVSVYINAENFTDTRQSRYKNVVNGSHTNPNFDEIWTHTEGFVISGGLKIKL
ncbi:MAG: TonB-dependent receptor [Chitinophagales bacterium]